MENEALGLKKLGCAMIDEISGEEIRVFREELGLTQKQFSESLGIPLSTLRKWEQDVAKPRASGRALLRRVRELAPT